MFQPKGVSMLRQIIITTVAVFSLTALINLLCVMPPDPNRDDNAKVKDISLENIFISSPDSNIVLIDKEFDIKLSLMLVYRIDSLTVDLDDGNDTVIMPGEWDTLLTLKHLYNSTGKKVIEATIYTETAKPKTSTITAIVVKPAKLIEKEITVSRIPDFVNKGVKLSVSANGSENIEYSWYKDTSLIFKSDDSVYTIDSLTETDTGEYFCIVNNFYGSDTSFSYKLSLDEYLPPVIQNERKIFSEGEMKIDSRCFLYITTSDSQKLTYQWYKDNNVIINETSDTLVFSSLSVDDNGVYKCVVTNEYGSDTSLEYTIEVFENVKPIIQNNKEIVASGPLLKDSTVTLSISASGTEPLSYSWYKEGSETVLSTEQQLTLENLSTDAEGEYYCIVTNVAGSDTSNVYMIKLENRKPFVISQPDTFKLVEDQSETIEIELDILDPDNDTVFWKIIETPVKGTVSSDSGTTLSKKPLFSYTLKPDSNGVDSLEIEYTDNENSGKLTIHFKIESVNDAPELVDPVTVIEIKENETKMITYEAFDKDGDIPFLGLAPAQEGIEIPDWITASESVDQITVILKPDHSIASNAIEYINHYFSIKAFDGTDSTFTKIKVVVENENRAPIFRDLPESVNCPVGDTVEIELSGTDPDGDDFTFSINNPENGMNIVYNRFVWFIPHDKYCPDDSKVVSLRISDETDYSDTTFSILFQNHEWELLTYSTDINALFAAKNRSTIFKLEHSDPNGIIYKSNDNGKSWNMISTIELMNQNDRTVFEASQSTLFLLWEHLGKSAYYLSYINESGSIFKKRTFFSYFPSFCVSPDGSTIMGVHYGVSRTFTIYYENGSIDTTHYLSTYLPGCLSVGNKYAWGHKSSDLYCMENLQLDDSLCGFKPLHSRSTVTGIANDGNDGDTIYAYDSSSLSQYIFDGPSGIDRHNISINQIVMFSGEVGWLVNNNGEIHYTNNGFKTTHKDFALIENNDRYIKKIFRAADGTMFAYGQHNGKTYLFRY